MDFEEILKTKKVIIGMIHLAGFTQEKIFEQAKREIAQMYGAGVDAVLVENYFGGTPDVVRVLAFLQENYPNRLYGVNVLGNYAYSYELAQHYGGSFMQVDSVCGHLRPKADRKYAEMIAGIRGGGKPVFVLGGVRFKYQPIRSGRSLEEDLRLGMERCDAIVVTGSGTGVGTDMEKIRTFRRILGDFPLIVGAGMTVETCQEQLSVSDGAIVGSYFKRSGRTEQEVDPQRLDTFMERVRAIR